MIKHVANLNGKQVRLVVAIVVVLSLFGVGSAPTQAESTNFATLNSFTPEANADFFIGIEFTVTGSPKIVSELGIIDGNNNGVLSRNTGVGLYSVSPGNCCPKMGTYIAGTIVPAGTAPSPMGVR